MYLPAHGTAGTPPHLSSPVSATQQQPAMSKYGCQRSQHTKEFKPLESGGIAKAYARSIVADVTLSNIVSNSYTAGHSPREGTNMAAHCMQAFHAAAGGE